MHKNYLRIVCGLLLLTAGCSNSSVESLLSDADDAVINTSVKGSITAPGETFDIEIRLEDDRTQTDFISLRIMDSYGEEVYATEFSGSYMNDFYTQLNIPENLDSGRYDLELVLYSQDEEVAADRFVFYISESGNYIKAITTFPPVFYPGSSGLVIADFESPEASAWVRWTLEDELITEGYLSAGYERINLKASEAEGIYRLQAELYPYDPSIYEDTPAMDEPSVKRYVSVYVKKDQLPADLEFSPDSDFTNLYHFRGNFINTGRNSGSPDPVLFGEAFLNVERGVFGYLIAPDSGLSFNESLLPLDWGVLQPFSVMFSIVPQWGDTDFNGDTLFFSRSGDENYTLHIKLSSDGSLHSEFRAGDSAYELSTEPGLVKNRMHSELSLAVEPDGDYLSLALYSNGILVSTETFRNYAGADRAASDEARGSGITSLFSGSRIGYLVDEFGIYNSPDSGAVDPLQFHRSMDKIFGSSLVLAEGFDSPGKCSISIMEESFITDSRLYLHPGSAAKIPALFSSAEELSFTIDSVTGNLPLLVTIQSSGAADSSVTIELVPEIRDGISAYRFMFISSGQNSSIQYQDKSIPVDINDYSNGIECILRNKNRHNLPISDILILRKSLSVAGMSDSGSMTVAGAEINL